LDVRPALDGHLSPPGHFEIGRTDDDPILDREGRWRNIPPVSGDNGLCFHFGEDIGQDLLGIVVGVSDDAFRREGQSLSSLPEQRDGLLLFIMIRREGLFVKREFGDRIV